MTQTEASGADRGKMILIAALFAAPVIAATLLYAVGWRPSASVNHGELVQPARPIHDVPLRSSKGESTGFDTLPKKWTMLYFVGPVCDAGCEAILYNLHQVHLALGKDADRVQRVVIVSSADPSVNRALATYPGAVVLTGGADQVRALRSQFGDRADDRVYLVDPLRNYFMSYPPGANPSGMRKDLARLLKVSRIG